MDTWTSITSVQHIGHDKLSRHLKIGVTRWWSKDKALSSIMDLKLNVVLVLYILLKLNVYLWK